MLDHQLHPDDGILVVRPQSPLSQADFETLGRELDPWLVQHGPLDGLMIEADAFPGWDSFTGMITHFRFVRDHHKQIRRVAMVSDGTLLAIAPKLGGHFVAAEVRHFAADRRDEAMAWLKEGRRL